MQAVQIYFNIVFSILLKLKKYTHTLKKIIDWAFSTEGWRIFILVFLNTSNFKCDDVNLRKCAVVIVKRKVKKNKQT